MAIDPSIALGFRPPEQPSQMNMLAQAMQLQGLQRQNQLGQMQMEQARASQAEQQALKNYLSGGANLDTPEWEQGLYRVAPTQAAGLLKGRLDLNKTRTDIGKTTAETEEKKFKLRQEQIGVNLQRLATINSPDQVPQWLEGGVASGLITREQAQAEIASVPRDPQGFAQWKQQQQQAGMTLAQQMEQQLKQQKFGLDAANEMMTPDGQGGYRLNQPLIDAKQQVAKAGASSVSVNTGQKGFDNTLKLRGDFRSEPVYKAHQEMQSAYAQIKQSLKQASPAGDLAGATKIMKLLDPGSVVRESELGMAMAASGLLDRVQNYAGMVVNGTKLTPTQRADFQKLADALYSESVNQYNAKRGEYKGIVDRNQLNEADVIGPETKAPATPSDIDALVNKYRTPANGNAR